MDQLTSVITELYPTKNILHMPCNYLCFGRVALGATIVGSVLPGGNSKSSSVVMAQWVGSGNSITTSNACMRVGVVQHFIVHRVKFQAENGPETVEHVFAYVPWKKMHPNTNYYGVTTTVSSTLSETPSACSFFPAQRIASTTAHATLTVDFGIIKESVFVNTPIPISYFL